MAKFSALYLFNAPAPPENYTLSLHDALPISPTGWPRRSSAPPHAGPPGSGGPGPARAHPGRSPAPPAAPRSEEHTSELQSHSDLVCRLLLEKKKIVERLHAEATQADDLVGVF